MVVIELAVRATPARWWHAHKENIASWDDFKRSMESDSLMTRSNSSRNIQEKVTPGHILRFVNRVGWKFQRMNGFTYSFTL